MPPTTCSGFWETIGKCTITADLIPGPSPPSVVLVELLGARAVAKITVVRSSYRCLPSYLYVTSMLPNCYLLLTTSYLLGFLTCITWANPATPSPRQLSVRAQATLQQEKPSNYQSDEISGFTFKPLVENEPSMTVKAVPTMVYRPRSLEALHRARLRSLHLGESEAVEWDRIDVLGPDIEDKHTLSQLARMAGNAYALPGQNNWYEVDMAWNTSFPFGWKEGDGFRGHVFLSSDNSTVILSIKGTTLQGPTSKLDKFNDNLLFSCCCARVDITWVFRTVCGCYAHNWRCDDPCLTKALIQDSLFYSIGVKLVDDLLHIYPSANVWLVGHSLGGAIASLLGSTYGLPAVAFESPGERLAASRLHLPLPRPENGSRVAPVAVTHVYHTGDPIPQGVCTGFGSACAQAGFALETRCHLGKSMVFDTVNKLGWKVDVRKHVIRQVITKVLEIGDVEWEDGRTLPVARAEEDCVDCYKWEFGHFKEEDEDEEQL